MKKILLLIGAAVTMAACSESATAPAAATVRKAPTNGASNDLTCRSGYVVAYDENGNPYCALIDGNSSRSKP